MGLNKNLGLSAVALLWLGACSGEQSSDPQPTTDASTPVAVQDSETAADVPQGLVYDLRGARQFRELVDMYGRIVRRTYELADGTPVVVDYEWDGGSNDCIAAKARAKGKLIAEGKFQRVAGNEREGSRLEVEELQYREDGTVAYRGTSTFALGFPDEKIGEWPQEGRKLYEVFLNWGTLMPGGPF